MTPRFTFAVILWCLFICSFASSVMAQSNGSGAHHMPEYNPNCGKLNPTTAMSFARTLPGFKIVPDLSFAYYGGPVDNAGLCLTTLQDDSQFDLDGLAFMITELDGMPLEELTTPQQTSMAPLESCWPKHLVFEDINGDKITDILMLIGCFNKATDKPRNDNVAYLSTVREGQIWLQQYLAINRAVSCYELPDLAVAAAKAALRE